MECGSGSGGFEEDGAVLVRPDRFVAWRWHPLDGVGDCDNLLLQTMRKVVGFGFEN